MTFVVLGSTPRSTKEENTPAISMTETENVPQESIEEEDVQDDHDAVASE